MAPRDADDDTDYSSGDDTSVEDGFMLNPREIPCKTRALAVIWPGIICVVCNITYMLISFFPNRRYLEWVVAQRQMSPACWPNNTRLSDLLLDAVHGGSFPGPLETDAYTPLSDTFPTVCLAISVLYILFRGRYIIINRFFLTQGFMIILNTIVENVTTLPSSYGYDRCIAYLGVDGPEDVTIGLNLMGSCAAMIWSGHTLHTLFACYMAGLALEIDFPFFAKPPHWVVHPKVFLCFVFGGLEAFLLIMASAHYSVDIALSFIVGLLFLTNHSIKVTLVMVNPWLRKMIHKEELELLTASHEKLRNMVLDKRKPYSSS
jgi:hypothetical protein